MRLTTQRAKSVTLFGAFALTVAIGLVTALAVSTTASNGRPVLAGARNHERNVTTLVRDNTGPALRLQTHNAASAPLTVNATGRVRHLNADRVDGRDARTLLTRASVFRAGRSGDVLDTGGLWALNVDPGVYTVSMRAILTATPNDPNATAVSVICGVIDLDTFNTPNTRVYLADSTVQIPDQLPAAMSGASTVRIRASENPGALCISPDASVQLFKPVVLNFTNVDRRTFTNAPAVPLAKRQLVQGLLPR